MDDNRLVKTVMFGEMSGQPRRGRLHWEWLDDITDWCNANNIQALVHAAPDHNFWSEIVSRALDTNGVYP